ncbi:hypothetical protein AUEXF2481DRAFT_578754 [Aureobasidium subglaciale EXF-2481]|uniref:Uncharacterized protein n=1 Tax=Aureobasidium subglaciale (strain EXF-2481) TaxID=1043005 RepID=A0A074XXQ0_AURSE|nr:uncharacterized protein AUEXF2481DRAFT_578754 [Aureobasidium subglaciale EXF-2481]KEQ90250.1 hypothetical protein AUEXF2481DRAFT_578754 [Aureobasidium subglaciale EXF-2481]
MGRRLSVLCGSTQILLTRHAHSMELTRKLYYSSLLSYFSISVGVFRNVGSTSRVLPTALRLENIETLSHSRRIPVASSTNHIQVCTLRVVVNPQHSSTKTCRNQNREWRLHIFHSNHCGAAHPISPGPESAVSVGLPKQFRDQKPSQTPSPM